MSEVKSLPSRQDVPLEDTWDLSKLFGSDANWEKELEAVEKVLPEFQQFQGKLGDSAESLCECLTFDSDLDRRIEQLGNYAFLKMTEDQANSTYQRLVGRFQHMATQAAEQASFIRPEILAIPAETFKKFIEDEKLARFKIQLERLQRYQKHTLSQREEQLLAMQGEMAQSASKAFRQLLDADLKFGEITNDKGELVELTNSSFIQMLNSSNRDVRKTAFHQFYEQFEGHKNTLAATLNGSVQTDIYYAKARNYDSALDAALFSDNVPRSVYENLIKTVRGSLDGLYRYYDLRRRKMGLDEIHHYDTYVPILSEIKTQYSWDQAVDVVIDSLEPLGSDYTSVLEAGLRGRWCDRYPNKGKQSGAFSSGGFDCDPYILMNYHDDILNDVFTLTHEAGHSMHTYYSKKNQPFETYDYTIFVAEVASTFNEQLLSKRLQELAKDDKNRAYLINNEIDDIRGTIIRQTMFAEFELIIHEMAESGEPLTIEALRETYSKLLKDYFGPDFTIDEELSLECLRIPHFYRAFYVYKYATGMSAAIALSQRVLNGGEAELKDYLNFLKGGSSLYPLDLLRGAGVDMEQPQPVEVALKHFGALVDELDSLL